MKRSRTEPVGILRVALDLTALQAACERGLGAVPALAWLFVCFLLYQKFLVGCSMMSQDEEQTFKALM